MAHAIVDLRSDTVTRPSAAMRRAMAEAEVGDDWYGQDPTVNRLQRLAAERLGKDAAMYVPSGTMANQIAVRLLTEPGSAVVCPERAHVRLHEAGGAGWNAGVQFETIPDPEGNYGVAELETALSAGGYGQPSIRLVWMENTHMTTGGIPTGAKVIREVASLARANRLSLHCDGARIFNAAVTLGVDAAELAGPFDTVMFCLSKGLGAPVGSVLAGTQDLIDAAWDHRLRLGGQMRQAGVIAAAGIVALETMTERLVDDHGRARRLAEMLADRFPGSVDVERVHTNMVFVDTNALPPGFVETLRENGIWCLPLEEARLRFVTHVDIDDDDMARVESVLDSLVAQSGS